MDNGNRFWIDVSEMFRSLGEPSLFEWRVFTNVGPYKMERGRGVEKTREKAEDAAMDFYTKYKRRNFVHEEEPTYEARVLTKPHFEYYQAPFSDSVSELKEERCPLWDIHGQATFEPMPTRGRRANIAVIDDFD